jgi:hypothetical protein
VPVPLNHCTFGPHLLPNALCADPSTITTCSPPPGCGATKHCLSLLRLPSDRPWMWPHHFTPNANRRGMSSLASRHNSVLQIRQQCLSTCKATAVAATSRHAVMTACGCRWHHPHPRFGLASPVTASPVTPLLDVASPVTVNPLWSQQASKQASKQTSAPGHHPKCWLTSPVQECSS